MSYIISNFISLVVGFFANVLYAGYEKRKIGKKRHLYTKTVENVIIIEGKIDNTETSQKYVAKLNNIVNGSIINNKMPM